ncbi:hypothetical protein [Marinobacter nauticus]|uniref:hypothetical protein n=1 Tax=Marinobacter nauticus TaxID=2743 RepID=UPI001C58E714|nr:hypothetical protein [Marinobacter nauticus]MBW3199010.1 hypothetical protein [Marinobacter nauticus]MBY6184420.1 hypothetical protein [Marinobacter nauticus]
MENDLVEQLKKQMEFISNSALLFDQGKINEAVRIGLSMRVLLHDTMNSRSLLALLKVKGKTKLLSTLPKEFDGIKTFGFGLTGVFHGPNVAEVQPNYERYQSCKLLGAHQWWNEKVFAMPEIGAFSRRDFSLIAANKDGGAHVAKLPERFQRIKDGNTNISIKSGTAETNFSEVWPATLRQMAWELENSQELLALYQRS